MGGVWNSTPLNPKPKPDPLNPKPKPDPECDRDCDPEP